MTITKALIAAAGWSTRFLPAVKSYAKHLVPILDKPSIQYLVEGLVSAGVTDICIVHRPGETTLKKHFSPDPELESFLQKTNKTHYTAELNKIIETTKFTFIEQGWDLPYGNATPILAASSWIGTDSFFYLYGDDLIVEDNTGEHVKNMLETYAKYQPLAMATCISTTPEQIMKCGSIKYKKGSQYPNQIETVIEKPPREQIFSEFAMVSPFILPAKILEIISSMPIQRGELWNTDAVNILSQQGPVLSQQATGHWTTTGDPTNWLLTNILFALRSPELKQKITDLLKDHT